MGNTKIRTALALGAAATLFGMAAAPAAAYVGPGAGLSAIGVLLALIATVLLAVIGFVWYPLRRLFRKKAPSSKPGEAPSADSSAES
jgi:hypothetical protein